MSSKSDPKCFCLSTNGRHLFGLGLFVIQGAQLIGQTNIFFEPVILPVQKIPIQGGEGTGVGAYALFRFEGAGGAKIAHPMDIIAAGAIRFGADDTAVTELAHPQGVRQGNPIDGVHIHGQMPVMKFPGVDAEEQGEQANYHKPVNMVGVAMSQDEFHGLPETVHISVAVPVKSGQVGLMIKIIEILVIRHMQPIEAPDVFPPTYNLADETFHTI